MAKSIMIQGTMSNAGKSLLTAGLCRIFMQDGYRVAPFKSQNMALNSFITKDGLEMGRAQAVQAQAAGIEPDVRMNPILLKPTTDMGSQVIVNGIPVGNMHAMNYFRKKKEYLPVITKAYHELALENDIIVIEGAGSPAEINLKKDDIVNMGMAKIAEAPVLLTGDIDRGGVFAQLVGTLELLEEEDSLAEGLNRKEAGEGIDVAVIRLPRISNFTDFQALAMTPFVSVRYVDRVSQLGKPDVIILPGTKSTTGDLKWLRQCGLEEAILRLHRDGTLLFGICGGYQMLGERIEDPDFVEGEERTVKGIGLLPVATCFEKEKTRTSVTGAVSKLSGRWQNLSGKKVKGYEIHMGNSFFTGKDACSFTKINGVEEGCIRENVMGTYLHGIFDEEEFREAFLKILCQNKGINAEGIQMISYEAYRQQQYDRLAAVLRESLDLKAIYKIIKEGA